MGKKNKHQLIKPKNQPKREFVHDDFLTISQLHVLSGKLIDVLDKLQETHLYNPKLHRTAKIMLDSLEPIFRLFHSQTLDDAEKEARANEDMLNMHTCYQLAVENLYKLPIEKLHFAPALLEQLLNDQIIIEP